MAREVPRVIYCSMMHHEGMNVYLASSDRGAVRVEARLGKASDPVSYMRRLFPSDRLVPDQRVNEALADAVLAALNGMPPTSALRLDIEYTLFQMQVWSKIAEIPFGKTMTYGEVARAVGSPGAARAVGQAMARNPLPLIFP